MEKAACTDRVNWLNKDFFSLYRGGASMMRFESRSNTEFDDSGSVFVETLIETFNNRAHKGHAW